jgi:hypothetical protein
MELLIPIISSGWFAQIVIVILQWMLKSRKLREEDKQFLTDAIGMLRNKYQLEQKDMEEVEDEASKLDEKWKEQNGQQS